MSSGFVGHGQRVRLYIQSGKKKRPDFSGRFEV
jgi:hypothetical protein